MSIEEVERIMDETQDAIEYQRVSLHPDWFEVVLSGDVVILMSLSLCSK